MKLSLETAPAQRPHGVLGVWSPILSAVGNAFKIQVGLNFTFQVLGLSSDNIFVQIQVVPSICRFY